MPMLRKTVIDTVMGSLDATRFGRSSYDVTFPDQGQVLLEITFRPFADYKFSVNELRGSSLLRIDLSPGAYQNRQSVSVDGLDRVHEWLETWTRYVYEEVRARGSLKNAHKDVQDFLDEYVQSHVAEPEESFTREELESIHQRLAELEEKFSQLHAAAQIDDRQFKELSKEVAQAEQDSRHLPKGIWYRASMGKILATLKHVVQAKESRQLIVDLIRKQLGVDP